MKHLEGKWKKHIPIFEVELHLVVSNTTTKAFNRLPKSFRTNCEAPDTTCTAYSCSDNDGQFAILLGIDCSDGFVGHEVRHTVDFMMAYIEAKPKWEGESMALLTHYITDWVYSKILNK